MCWHGSRVCAQRSARRDSGWRAVKAASTATERLSPPAGSLADHTEAAGAADTSVEDRAALGPAEADTMSAGGTLVRMVHK